MAFALDPSTTFGARVARRLEADLIGWLVTVNGRGAPQPSPVWFLWDDRSILLYSQPDTPKLRNIAANPRVALHLNDVDGEDVVILSGRAAESDDRPAHELPVYLEKYADLIAGNGWTPESFAADYSVPVRIRPTGLRGF
ncbi:MAG TPA: TIGR03667 family PPOX class F420-dependent oxidoreductase [Gaiellales bacterium]|nr:TIGR03667 family PPOX class F420-dependent oxidoreductase [Gaiellales bacterium]